jgi:small multidrug resistance pump
MAIIFLIIAFILNAAASILLKLHAVTGFNTKNVLSLSFISENIYFFIALVLFGLNVVFYTLALSKLPLSIAYPVMVVMSFIIVNSFSFIYFKEHILTPQVLGYVFILIGIALVVGYARV